MSAPRPAIEAVATTAQRLAVLLAAGVPPNASWRYLASTGRSGVAGRVVDAAARSGDDGADIAHAVAEAGGTAASAEAARAWRALAAVWSLAIETGSPLAGALREMAESFRATGRLQREARIALAGPRATSRLVALLPVVAVAFGAVLGLDTLGVLFTTVPGWVCLAAGSLLMLGGSRWSARLVRRAGVGDPFPGLVIDLIALALAGGASLDRARGAAAAVVVRLEVVDAATAAEQAGRADSVIALARDAGVPAAELLRAEASDLRLAAQTDGQERAARLGVSLMIPLALCVLPAFMLLGVAPMILSVVSSTFDVLG
ncbi:MAG: type II secretion system F family protein [Leifsonia flava]